MVTSLPLPIEFRLPDHWRAADPDEVGVPGVAFVAVRPGSTIPGFTTNITIDGHGRTDATPLTDIANDSIEQLHSEAQSVSVIQRTEFGSTTTPGLTQVVRVRTEHDGNSRQLTQCQVYLSMPDAKDSDRRAIVRIVLTTPAEQFSAVIGEFQKFIATVRPDTNPQ